MSSEKVIREQIDDLATRLMLADAAGPSPEGIATALAGIAECARAAGCMGTARTASGLVETCQAGPPTASLEALQEGIARLQQTLEEDARGADTSAELEKNPLALDPELLQDFVTESREHLTSIEQQSLTLEQDPSSTEAVHSLFRSFHTIKGLAGFLELADIGSVAHEVETALDLARNGSLSVTGAVIDVILESADYLSRAVQAVESTLAGAPGAAPGPDDALLGRIRGLLAAPAGCPREVSVPEVSAREVSAPDASAPKEVPGKKPAETFSVRVDTGKLDYLVDMVGEMVIAQSLVRHDPELTEKRRPDPARATWPNWRASPAKCSARRWPCA